MNLKEIKEMISLMNENGLQELEMERGDLKIRLKKTAGGTREERLESVAGALLPAETGESRTKSEVEGKGIFEIRSPMVGTFYRSSAPDAEPFIEVGQEIVEDQIVCIIEAMKLMNEIKSEAKGKIIEILVENGEAVEFDQVLFRAKTSG